MERIVIRPLVAQDETVSIDVAIDPGVVIGSFRIERHSNGYNIVFVAEGRQLRCALAQFQARTAPAVRGDAREPAEHPIAV